MWTAKLLHALGQGILISLACIINQDRNNLKNPTIQNMYLFTIKTYTYVVDFLNMVALLYLFYCQGKAVEVHIS